MASKLFTYTVSEDGERFDVVATKASEVLSRSQVQKLIERELILINGQPAKPRQLLKVGDIIQGSIPEEPIQPAAEAVALSVVYEDEFLLVVNKPAGMVVHPQFASETGSLVGAVLYRNPEVGEAVYDIEQPVSRLRPGIVHRLDKDTSGLIVVAKTVEVLHLLSEQFRTHSVEKRYTALVWGEVKEAVSIRNWLIRKPGLENIMGVSRTPGQGREAITILTPMRTFGEGKTAVSLTSCRIETGRTHQIRVHAKYIGHPVLGDKIYSNKPSAELSEKLGIARQMLHASTLTFTHPVHLHRLELAAELPEDLQRVLTELERTG